MATQEWRLVAPVPRAASEPRAVVVGERSTGHRLGVLSNRKPNASVMGEEFMRLAQGAGIAESVAVYEKPEGPGMPASAELLDRIAAECDAVVVGTAD
jgi:hypothetical protein